MREHGDSHRALNLAKSSDDLALLVRPEHLVPLSSLTDYLGFRVRRRRPSFKVGLDVVPVGASVGGGGEGGEASQTSGAAVSQENERGRRTYAKAASSAWMRAWQTGQRWRMASRPGSQSDEAGERGSMVRSVGLNGRRSPERKDKLIATCAEVITQVGSR